MKKPSKLKKTPGDSETAKSLPLSDDKELKTEFPLSEKDEMQKVAEEARKKVKTRE